MDAAQPFAKVYASHCTLESGDFIKTFHRWIQQKSIGELLIDVADYSHVHHGPGVLLVAHESYYGMDHGEGRIGMKFKSRRGDAAPAVDGLRAALKATLDACALMQDDHGDAVRFDGSELLVGFDDRLHAPNDRATFERLEPALEQMAGALFDGASRRIEPVGDARAPFRARIAVDAAVDIATLRERLA